MTSFVRQHPKHALAIALALGIGSIFFMIRSGYDWGQYRVRSGDTLSDILVKALGDPWLGYAALNNLQSQGIETGKLWRNVGRWPFLDGGDRIGIQGNTFYIVKPNESVISGHLFPAAAYTKRLRQAFAHNILLGVTMLAMVALIFTHALDGLRFRWSESRVFRGLMKLCFMLSVAILWITAFALTAGASNFSILVWREWFEESPLLVWFIGIMTSFGIFTVAHSIFAGILIAAVVIKEKVIKNSSILPGLIGRLAVISFAASQIINWIEYLSRPSLGQ